MYEMVEKQKKNVLQKKPNNIIQLATVINNVQQDVNYKIGSHNKNDTVGIRMNALLDTTDKVQGTTTAAKEGIYKSYDLVQGHLLSARLGGEAKSSNLFPFSSELNHAHSGIEYAVMGLYATEEKKTTDKKRIKYNVTVNDSTGFGTQYSSAKNLLARTSITCVAGLEGDADTLNVTLKNNVDQSTLPGTSGAAPLRIGE